MKKKENEVPVQIAVMQPTVINESKPVDIAYLWLVLEKQKRDLHIMDNSVALLKKLVTDLERAYTDENTPGSGFFSTAEVDILISDLLTKAIQLVQERKINLDVALRHIISPEKPVTTVGDFAQSNSREGKFHSNNLNGNNETVHYFEGGKEVPDPSIKNYPMRPEECFDPEDVIE